MHEVEVPWQTMTVPIPLKDKATKWRQRNDGLEPATITSDCSLVTLNQGKVQTYD